MISIKHRFLFVHIPNTGGNNIQKALSLFSKDKLEKNQEFHDGKERFGLENAGLKYHKHSILNEYKRVLPEIIYNSLTKFTVVRNPWDRMISRYFSPHKGRMEFDKEVFKRIIYQSHPIEFYVNSNPKWLRFFPNNPLKRSDIDCFLKFEDLEEEFLRICSVLGLKDVSLEKLNKSERIDYRYYYDNSLKDMVNKKFKKEIDFFEYTFD